MCDRVDWFEISATDGGKYQVIDLANRYPPATFAHRHDALQWAILASVLRDRPVRRAA